MQSEFAAAGIPVAHIGRRFAIDPLADVRLARHVARLRPDVVHTWGTVPGLFGPVMVRAKGGWGRDKNERLARPRIIAGYDHIGRYQSAWARTAERLFARYVDRFVANSPTVRDWCVGCGLPAERFVVIQWGVSSGTGFGPLTASDLQCVPRRDDLLRELNLPANARLIGVIGRLTHEKRVKDLIWAADLLRVLHENLRVLIIGDGRERAQLERYARLASDLEHIRFLGERADVPRIMPHLDVLWNADENTGPSLAILEATAAGIPVIASDTPSNRELIVEGETGHLIPLGTRAGRAARARATDRIFNDAEMARRLANAAVQRAAKQFRSELMVQHYAAAYDL
jgi:glycosyltransferase involved in cell wall biosynthesis